MTSLDLNIRRSTGADRRALERLAALDSRPLGEGRYLVADLGGEIVAAVSLDDATTIANPFRHTAAIVAMLELRAAEAAAARGRDGTGLIRRAARPLSRAAAQA